MTDRRYSIFIMDVFDHLIMSQVFFGVLHVLIAPDNLNSSMQVSASDITSKFYRYQVEALGNEFWLSESSMIYVSVIGGIFLWKMVSPLSIISFHLYFGAPVRMTIDIIMF